MSDLNLEEQAHVRAALRVLRVRCEGWLAVSKVLGICEDSITHIARGAKPVSARVAFRVARFVGIGVDDLLLGKWVPKGMCPYCGHVAEVSEPSV